MVDKLDAGPIYFKHPLKLNGTAQEIYERASKIIFNIINNMINNKLEPISQTGKPVVFKRRKMEQSIITKKIKSLNKLYNHIRMLDAKSYPRAYLRYGNLKIELTKPKIVKGLLTAQTKIKVIKK